MSLVVTCESIQSVCGWNFSLPDYFHMKKPTTISPPAHDYNMMHQDNKSQSRLCAGMPSPRTTYPLWCPFPTAMYPWARPRR